MAWITLVGIYKKTRKNLMNNVAMKDETGCFSLKSDQHF